MMIIVRILSALVLLTVVHGVAFDPVYNPANSHYYTFVDITAPITYSAANDMASATSLNGQQGYVVTETDKEEAWFVGNTTLRVPWVLSSTSSSQPTYWGGLHRLDKLWYWFALSRISSAYYDVTTMRCINSNYCNWQSTPSDTTIANCSSIYLNNSVGTQNQWKQMNCSSTADSLIVEYDASTSCQPGFMLHSTINYCVDFDECAVGNICGNGYQCVNRVGTYDCKDINECELSSTLCEPGYACSNTIGSYNCVETSFYIQSQLNDLYAEVSTTTAGSQIVMQPKYTDAASRARQLWRFAGGLIKHEATGMFFTVSGGLLQRGREVVLDVLHDTANQITQKWSISFDGFIATQGGPVTLDIFRNDRNPGAKLIVWDPKKSDNLNQKFRIINS